MKKGFSLIELLISLITISVILASLAPVVTHKLKHGGISIAQGESVTNSCTSFGANCQLCTKKKCLLCIVTCPDGQYADKESCTCKSCIANCNSCINNTSCNRCKAGYQKSGNSCSACGAGYYSTEGGTCQKCAKGTKANANSAATGCTGCTGNQYQDEEGKTDCKTCTSGFVSDSNRACSSCAAGKYWNGVSCQNCAAGSYSSSANVTSCTQCSTGTYQPSAGQTSCLSCNGANQYQDSTGQTSCKNCTDGKTPNSSHTGCDAVAVACPSACKTCANGSTNCATCADGKYLDGTTCSSCPTGCKKCTSATRCSDCDTGYELSDNLCKKFRRPTSQADCDRISSSQSIFIPSEVDKYDKDGKKSTNGSNGICVTKINAGDQGGPEISSAVTEVSSKTEKKNSTCENNGEQKCCWTGHSGKSPSYNTAKLNTTNTDGSVKDRYCTDNPAKIHTTSSIFGYEACRRTVCNWYAAEYICANYSPGETKAGDWHIPTYNNLDTILKAIEAGPTNKTDTSASVYIQRYSGVNGLQLCQNGSSHNTAGVGSPRCDLFASRCNYKGDSTIACAPSYIHGYDGYLLLTGKAYEMHSKKDIGNSDWAIVQSRPSSVRCVLEKYEITD